MISSLLPQPARGTATASRPRIATRRRIGRRTLSEARDGGAGAARLVVLEDRAQAPQALRALALEPAAHAEALHQPVRERPGPGLDSLRHARHAARALLELVDAAQPRAVVLAAASGHHDAARRVDLGEGDVGEVEALQRRLVAEAPARPLSRRVDARHAPVARGG